MGELNGVIYIVVDGIEVCFMEIIENIQQSERKCDVECKEV